jgi:hypothetical protein
VKVCSVSVFSLGGQSLLGRLGLIQMASVYIGRPIAVLGGTCLSKISYNCTHFKPHISNAPSVSVCRDDDCSVEGVQTCDQILTALMNRIFS